MQLDALLREAEACEVMRQAVAAGQQVRGVVFGEPIRERERILPLEEMQPSRGVVAVALQAVQRPLAQAHQVAQRSLHRVEPAGQDQ